MNRFLSKVAQAVIVFFVSACYNSNKNMNDDILIKGNIQNKQSGKIYLFDISKLDIPKDSTDIINGKFAFKYKADSSFLPYKAMLCIRDSFEIYEYLRPIGFVNPYLKKYFESIFFVDTGLTFVAGNIGKNISLKIDGSKQNIPMYKHVALSILDKKDSLIRRKEIAENINKIAEYPYSYYLIDQLYQNKEMYKKQELELLLSKFNDDIKNSSSYKKCNLYLLLKNREKKRFSNFFLETTQKKKELVLDTLANNLVIFWASWCAPCRKEIPYLKELYVKYNKKGLSLSSISLDNNMKNWNEAVKMENMPWKQFIINDSIKNMLDVELNLSAIPVIVFVDRKGNIIDKRVGIEEKEEEVLVDMIKKYFN
jgi:thiol-disulfide isomerase/thioredoxin